MYLRIPYVPGGKGGAPAEERASLQVPQVSPVMNPRL
jgi:hypothetical protein